MPNEPSNPVVGRLVAAINDGIWTRSRRRSPRTRRDADNHGNPRFDWDRPRDLLPIRSLTAEWLLGDSTERCLRRGANFCRSPSGLRKNGWTLAERAGEVSPDGMQRLLRHADWEYPRGP